MCILYSNIVVIMLERTTALSEVSYDYQSRFIPSVDGNVLIEEKKQEVMSKKGKCGWRES